MKSTPYWSIIVPVYNEANRLGNLNHIIRFLKSLPETWELIVVNDGSTDNTLDLVKAIQDRHPLQVVNYPQNQGKGYAIKQGMLVAKGRYRLFLDCDLSTPIEEINKIRPHLTNYNVVIGTRKTKGAKVLVHQPWLRENLGKGFTLLSRIMLNVDVSDFTCGFKCFSADAAQKIFTRSRIYRWGFDSEILYLSSKFGFAIKEIPVTWKNDLFTRVRFPRDLIISFSDLLRIRLNDLYNRY